MCIKIIHVVIIKTVDGLTGGFMSNITFYEVILRTVIAFTALFVFTRIMGKKQIAQLSFFDYIVGITIGSIAASLSTDTNTPIFNGFISLTIWSLASLLFSYIALKSMLARRLLEGVPTVVIKNGRIIRNNLKKERYHVNDLLEDLRAQGIFNIADVEFAILETDGTLSALRKSQTQALTPKDINVETKYEGLCANLIIDGKIMHENLKMIGLDKSWLKGELEKRNINSYKSVFLATLDTAGNIYINLMDNNVEDKSILQ